MRRFWSFDSQRSRPLQGSARTGDAHHKNASLRIICFQQLRADINDYILDLGCVSAYNESMNTMNALLREMVNLLADLVQETAHLTELTIGMVEKSEVRAIRVRVEGIRGRLDAVREALSRLHTN